MPDKTNKKLTSRLCLQHLSLLLDLNESDDIWSWIW